MGRGDTLVKSALDRVAKWSPADLYGAVVSTRGEVTYDPQAHYDLIAALYIATDDTLLEIIRLLSTGGNR